VERGSRKLQGRMTASSRRPTETNIAKAMLRLGT